MRCSLKFLASVALLTAPMAALAAPTYNIGTPLTPAEIKGFDSMVSPEGDNLPVGHGTSKEGEEIYAKRCEVCHGKNGRNGISRHLVAGSPGHVFAGTFDDKIFGGPTFYPNPIIAWDYINRAMPPTAPGSLSPNEVYAVVAYLYYQNGMIAENDEMNEKSLPKVVMPNRNGFVPAKPVYPPEKKPSWY